MNNQSVIIKYFDSKTRTLCTQTYSQTSTFYLTNDRNVLKIKRIVVFYTIFYNFRNIQTESAFSGISYSFVKYIHKIKAMLFLFVCACVRACVRACVYWSVTALFPSYNLNSVFLLEMNQFLFMLLNLYFSTFYILASRLCIYFYIGQVAK